MENNTTFEILNSINVNSMTEKKQTGGTTLTYLSWASAWAVAKANFPDTDIEYEIERNPETGLPYWYDPLTGYMVFTKVTIGGQTHEMWLPVLDGANRAMKAEPYEVKMKYKTVVVAAASMADINRSIMRCLVKNLAIFGLGLYIYQGEDVPSTDTEQVQPVQPPKPVEKPVQKSAQSQVPVKKDTRLITAEMVDIIRKIVGEHGVTGDFIDFICESYKVCKLEDLRIYQFNHIKQNIEKLKTMFDAKRKKRLADVIKNADITVDPAAVKPKDMGTTFGDAILSQQPQEKNEGEEVSLESLGLSPEEMEALIECGDVFS